MRYYIKSEEDGTALQAFSNRRTGLLKQANGILGLRSRCALSPGYHMAGFQPF